MDSKTEDTPNKIKQFEPISQKSLPKALQPYYELDCIKNPDITLEDKQNFTKIYGKNSKEWVQPRSAKAR